jgi:hypothetical protein
LKIEESIAENNKVIFPLNSSGKCYKDEKKDRGISPIH